MSSHIWIPTIHQNFIQPWPFLLRTPIIPLFLCCQSLLCNPNCGCVLWSQEFSSWLHGDQLPIPNNQLFLDCHLTLLHILLVPGLPLLWLNKFSLPPPLIFEILLNIARYEIEERKNERVQNKNQHTKKLSNETWNNPQGQTTDIIVNSSTRPPITAPFTYYSSSSDSIVLNTEMFPTCFNFSGLTTLPIL